MYVSLLAFILSAYADVQYVRTTYNFKPGSLQEMHWKKCAEIPYSYAEELEGYRRVSREIQTLLHGPDYFARAGEVSQLREKLLFHSERLNELARPEWNTENYEIHLLWIIPGAEFFPPPDRDDRGWPIKYGSFIEKSAHKVVLFGERRPDLMPPPWGDLLPSPWNDVRVRIRKPATFLEFCQLVRTVEVDYTVRYLSALAKAIPHRQLEREKKFKLIFEELP